MVISEDTCISQKKMVLFPYFCLIGKALHEKEGGIIRPDLWRINLNVLRYTLLFLSLFVVLFCLFVLSCCFFIIFSDQTLFQLRNRLSHAQPGLGVGGVSEMPRAPNLRRCLLSASLRDPPHYSIHLKPESWGLLPWPLTASTLNCILFIYQSTPAIFTEHLMCTRYYSRWFHEQMSQNSLSSHSSKGRKKKTQTNINKVWYGTSEWVSVSLNKEGIKETGSVRKSSGFRWGYLDLWGPVGISKNKTFEQLLGKCGEAQVVIWWHQEQSVKGPKTEMCLKCLKSKGKARNALRDIRGHR